MLAPAQQRFSSASHHGTAPSQVPSAVHVLTAAPLLELRVPAHGMFDGQLQTYGGRVP